jgi:hypothetical protein
MPVLKANPTVETAANAWTRGFAAAVRDTATATGRITAAKASEMTGPYADNAQNYFRFTGKSWTTADILIDSGASYVREKMGAVAGGNGKLSLAEIRTLPQDLVDDVLILRGKLTAPTAPANIDTLKDALQAMEIDRIRDYGKWFSLTTYPATKSKVDIYKDAIGYDQLTDDEARDWFDRSTSGAAASFAGAMADVGDQEKENADTTAEGNDLKARFDGVAAAARAVFGDAAKFESVELAEHMIAEDGDTELRVLIGKQKDGSFVVLQYSDFPF